ncbi:MAG: response regulator [Oscillospiraceae bacterium]|nr:response regulator [Oscillospiraceae bacterium]
MAAGLRLGSIRRACAARRCQDTLLPPEKDEALMHISHDMRAPIHVISGFTDLLLFTQGLSDQHRQQVLGIRSAAQTLLHLVNDILDLGKISAGGMQILPAPYHMAAMLEEMGTQAALRAKEKPVCVLMDVDPGLPRTPVGDEMRIKQVLGNLLTNAVKFTPQGRVTLRVHADRRAEGFFVCFEVEDTGIGIRKQDVPRLFQHFQQADAPCERVREGSGLGLAVSQRLVQRMGGKIQVESSYGQGARFFFSLPQGIGDSEPLARVFGALEKRLLVRCTHPALAENLCACAASLGVPVHWGADAQPDAAYTHVLADPGDDARAAWMRVGARWAWVARQGEVGDIPPEDAALIMPAHPAALADFLNYGVWPEAPHARPVLLPAARDVCVLLVDDDAAGRSVSAAMLALLGLTVVCAVDGAQALDMLCRQRFDVVFMDDVMPGMGGEATVARMRRQSPQPDVPVIVLTGNPASETAVHFAGLAVCAILTKPLDVEGLGAALRGALPPEKLGQGEAGPYARDARASDIGGRLARVAGLDFDAGLARCAQDLPLYMGLLSGLARDAKEKSALLRRAMSQADTDAISLCAHSAKGLLASAGHGALSRQAAHVEDLARRGLEAQVNETLPGFADALAAFGHALQEALRDVPGEGQLAFSLPEEP